MSDLALSPQQLQVVCALSSGATAVEAAAQAGVHRNTIAGWRRNFLPFQHALAEAQYDRALLFREKMEAQVDLAIAAIRAILADPAAPPSVRLKAAIAVIGMAVTPPPPRKQVQLEIQHGNVAFDTPLPNAADAHNPAQAEPAAAPQPSRPAPETIPPVHKNAQSASPDHPQTFRRAAPKIGVNEPCPCGSSKKYKRCCLNKLQGAPSRAA